MGAVWIVFVVYCSFEYQRLAYLIAFRRYCSCIVRCVKTYRSKSKRSGTSCQIRLQSCESNYRHGDNCTYYGCKMILDVSAKCTAADDLELACVSRMLDKDYTHLQCRHSPRCRMRRARRSTSALELNARVVFACSVH